MVKQSRSSLETPVALPHLNIPVAHATVEVRIINTTCYQRTDSKSLLRNPVHGHESMSFPSYAFLITNRTTSARVLFDLGMRKDWQNACPPDLIPHISDDGNDAPLQVSVEQDIVDILDQGRAGITSDQISAVIWSHHHFDHRGDMGRFGPFTRLIVGPNVLQGYLHTEIHESELAGREVIELEDEQFDLLIGNLPALDAFGDGSFFLLSSPGHTEGHLCGLARVTSSPISTFVLLGGDCAYHCGEFRPSPYVPLPTQLGFRPSKWDFPTSAKGPLQPPKLRNQKTLFCAGEFVKDIIHPLRSSTEPFYRTPAEPVVCDRKKAVQTIAKLQVFDAHDDVLVCMSHDPDLMSVLPFYPYTINDWYKMQCKQKVHWEFLTDFDLEGSSDIYGKRTPR